MGHRASSAYLRLNPHGAMYEWSSVALRWRGDLWVRNKKGVAKCQSQKIDHVNFKNDESRAKSSRASTSTQNRAIRGQNFQKLLRSMKFLHIARSHVLDLFQRIFFAMFTTGRLYVT